MPSVRERDVLHARKLLRFDVHPPEDLQWLRDVRDARNTDGLWAERLHDGGLLELVQGGYGLR